MRWCGEEISTEYQKDLLTPAATTRKIELKREQVRVRDGREIENRSCVDLHMCVWLRE